MNLKATFRTIAFDAMWLIVFAVGMPWLFWRYCVGKNRRGWRQKLFGWAPTDSLLLGEFAGDVNRKRIWLHAVSVGEVHLLKTLIQQLEKRFPNCEIHVSSTTETGFNRAANLFGNRYPVFFFPFDFSWAIRSVIERIRPDMLILAELELWPNLIHLASDSGVQIVVANGRLSENSHRNYKRFSFLTTPMFKKLRLVAAQDETYARRFEDLGCEKSRVVVSGNLKYDSICVDRNNPKAQSCRQIADHFRFSNSDPVIVAGSTQVEDEIAALDAWQKLRNRFPTLKLILVPRHPERTGELISSLKRRGVAVNMRSEFDSCTPDSDTVNRDVLIVDVIGELSGWWALADVAFVGGSMGSRGGQNMIEPAAYGVPVCFGPNVQNFKTTVDGLLARDAARVVSTSDELADFCQFVLSDHNFATEMGARSQGFVLQHQGATTKTVDAIESLFDAETCNNKRAAA